MCPISGVRLQPEGLCRECAPPASLLPPQWPGSLTAVRPLFPIPPSAAAFAGLWEASFSTQPVLPSPSKFMVFEAEEEMHIQKLLLIKGMQGMPLLAPPRPDSWGPQMSP